MQFPETSFGVKLKTDKKKPIVRLDFLDQKLGRRHERAGSVTSGRSSIRSDWSLRTSTEEAPQLQWIDIEFMDLADRDKFLSLWQS